MAGEDQERFEDYLELEHFIEELQAGHVAHPPDTLTPSKASIYRMAALFRSASPEEAEPRPEFAAELQARLEQELQQPAKPQPFLSKKPQKKPRISRRALLTGGAAAAASMVVGVGMAMQLSAWHNSLRVRGPDGLHRLCLRGRASGLQWRSWLTLESRRFALLPTPL